MEQDLVYLDHAASTPLRPMALETLCHSYAFDYANPSASHRWAKELAKKTEQARSEVLQYLKATADYRLTFMSSATEANNTLIKGLRLPDPSLSIVASPTDHPSLWLVAKQRATMQGQALLTYPLDSNGDIDQAAWNDMDWSRTGLLCVAHVNNSSGHLRDLKALVARAKKKNPALWVHVDGAQSFGKEEIALETWNIDSITLSAHKMGGPRGIGALIWKKTGPLAPLLKGGDHEEGWRSSTPATSLIFSWQTACGDVIEKQASIRKHMMELSGYLHEKMEEKKCPVTWPFAQASTVSYIHLLEVAGISSDILLRHLEEQGVIVSSSAACSSRASKENLVYSGLGISKDRQKNLLRVSFGFSTTFAEVDRFVDCLANILQELSFLFKRS